MSSPRRISSSNGYVLVLVSVLWSLYAYNLLNSSLSSRLISAGRFTSGIVAFRGSQTKPFEWKWHSVKLMRPLPKSSAAMQASGSDLRENAIVVVLVIRYDSAQWSNLVARFWNRANATCQVPQRPLRRASASPAREFLTSSTTILLGGSHTTSISCLLTCST